MVEFWLSFDAKRNDKYMNDKTFGVLIILMKKPTFKQIKMELKECLYDKFFQIILK